MGFIVCAVEAVGTGDARFSRSWNWGNGEDCGFTWVAGEGKLQAEM